MKHFTILCLMLCAATSAFSQGMLQKEIDNWERAKAYTKDYLDAMPEDGYGFKPTPEARTFAQQMGHLADANMAFVSAATGAKKPMDTPIEKMPDQSKAAVSKAVLASYDYVIGALKNVTEADWNKTVKVFNKFDITEGAAFEKAFEHQTHHRGQTTIYIRMKGATPPQERLF